MTKIVFRVQYRQVAHSQLFTELEEKMKIKGLSGEKIVELETSILDRTTSVLLTKKIEELKQKFEEARIKEEEIYRLYQLLHSVCAEEDSIIDAELEHNIVCAQGNTRAINIFRYEAMEKKVSIRWNKKYKEYHKIVAEIINEEEILDSLNPKLSQEKEIRQASERGRRNHEQEIYKREEEHTRRSSIGRKDPDWSGN
ncbi:MAG: hypothetical protein WCT19_04570 [Candidatus Paceibacterota bacterium]